MLQRLNGFRHTKTLFISALVVVLAACSNTSQSNVSSSTPSVSPSTQTPTAAQTNISIPGVESMKDIDLKPAKDSAHGYFDGVNRSTTKSQTISKAKPVQVAGWAVLPEEKRPADTVIITAGDNNSVVAVAPVRLNRVDVAQAYKNPIYTKSGWTATFNASALPANQVQLKAWAYNPTTKQATQLANTFDIAVQ